MKNCPVCNRVLVKKSDHSLTCMFCGWKGKAHTQELKTPETKTKAMDKKPETPVKIETNPENIAKQVLQEENSKLPLYVLIGAILITFLGFLSNQMFQKSDQPSISTESSPVGSESLQPSGEPSPVADTPSPLATPNAQEAATSSASPSLANSPAPSGSSMASPESSADPLLASPPAAESPLGESPTPVSMGSPGDLPADASSPSASTSAMPTATASP